ncbi:Laccase-3 [Hortaea werneckii]|nr:Laccase-3 [Hortaea werneckii]KAI7324242.1 Laccase-3 [Hortaea werneckii]KAI7381144.1 Laccase-3 [Hortaea werneckii]KAI7471461.1 Laccase-3 [Hortaea werneckii]
MKPATLALAFLAGTGPASAISGWGKLRRDDSDLKKVEADIEKVEKNRLWSRGPWGSWNKNATAPGLATGTGTGVPMATGWNGTGSWNQGGYGQGTGSGSNEEGSGNTSGDDTGSPNGYYPDGEEQDAPAQTSGIEMSTTEVVETTIMPVPWGAYTPEGWTDTGYDVATSSTPAIQTTVTVSDVQTEYITVYPTMFEYTSAGQTFTSSGDETSTVTSTYQTTLTLTVTPSAAAYTGSNGQPAQASPAKETSSAEGSSPTTVVTSTEVQTEYITIFPTKSAYVSGGKDLTSTFDVTSTVTSTYLTTITLIVPASPTSSALGDWSQWAPANGGAGGVSSKDNSPSTVQVTSTQVETVYTTIYPTTSTYASGGKDMTSSYDLTSTVTSSYLTTLTLTVPASPTSSGSSAISEADGVSYKENSPSTVQVTSTQVETVYTTVYPTTSTYSSGGEDVTSSYDLTSTITSSYLTTLTLTVPASETSPSNGGGSSPSAPAYGGSDASTPSKPTASAYVPGDSTTTITDVVTTYTTTFAPTSSYTNGNVTFTGNQTPVSTVTSTYQSTLTISATASGSVPVNPVTISSAAPSPTQYTTYSSICTETSAGSIYTTWHTHSEVISGTAGSSMPSYGTNSSVPTSNPTAGTGSSGSSGIPPFPTGGSSSAGTIVPSGGYGTGSSSSAAGPQTTSQSSSRPSMTPTSYTTFTSLCTENGTTVLHTHSQPISSNGTATSGPATGTGSASSTITYSGNSTSSVVGPTGTGSASSSMSVPGNGTSTVAASSTASGLPSFSANSTSFMPTASASSGVSSGVPSSSANSTSLVPTAPISSTSSGAPSNSANSTSMMPTASASSAVSSGVPSNSANSTSLMPTAPSSSAATSGMPSNSANTTSLVPTAPTSSAATSGMPSNSANKTSLMPTGQTTSAVSSGMSSNSVNSTSLMPTAPTSAGSSGMPSNSVSTTSQMPTGPTTSAVSSGVPSNSANGTTSFMPTVPTTDVPSGTPSSSANSTSFMPTAPTSVSSGVPTSNGNSTSLMPTAPTSAVSSEAPGNTANSTSFMPTAPTSAISSGVPTSSANSTSFMPTASVPTTANNAVSSSVNSTRPIPDDAGRPSWSYGNGWPTDWPQISDLPPRPTSSGAANATSPAPTSTNFPAGNITSSMPGSTGLASSRPLSSSSTSSASTCRSPEPTQSSECVPCAGQPGSDPGKFCGYTALDSVYEVMPITCKTREYNFEVTNTTLSPDGIERLVLAVNGQMPGPAITANWGDEIVVHVKNSMQNNGTTIHWHGLRQNYTNEMDGVPSITQCPIAPGDSMTYRFKASSYGTSWYHSHFAIQTYEGVYGPMIINGPSSSDDVYESEQMITLQDWSHVPVDAMYDAAQTVGPAPEHGPRTLDTGLINGMNVWGNEGDADVVGKRFEMNVVKGKTYKLRLVNSAIQSTFAFYIDSHKMKVIANDFVPIVPYETDVLFINIGQRYEVLVTFDQEIDDYWMRSDNQQSCASLVKPYNIKGIIRYEGSAGKVPTSTAHSYTADCKDEPLSKLVPYYKMNVGTIDDQIAKTVTIGGNGGNPNLYKWSLSGTTFTSKWEHPTLEAITEKGTIPDYSGNLAIEVPNLGEWVYIIIDSPIPFPHPIHLHGHDFFVVAQGTGLYNSNVELNLENPPRRDVAMMPWDPRQGLGGHLVIAFYTDNPGAWLAHCHVGWHVSMGFALQIIENQEGINDTVHDTCMLQDTCKNWREYAREFHVFAEDSGV